MDKNYRYGFLVILLSIGAIWLRSSIGKITGGKFVAALAPTLGKFASNNPNSWYSDFLKGTVIPNATFFGSLIMWGEFLSSVSIILGSLYLLLNKKENKIVEYLFLVGLIGGIFLNINFYFASGWMSPSTESLNLLMFVIQLIGVVVFGKVIFKERK